MGFEGFPEAGIRFLRDLALNNDREWFQANKGVFDDCVKAPMVALVEDVNARLRKFAPDYVAEPKRAIGRMNRDTRFTADKSPYKTEISAVFPRGGGERHEVAGFYLSVSGEAVEVIGGVYMPDPERLLALRHHLAKNAARFRRLVAASALKAKVGALQGERLQRVPRGFDPEDPAADLLRYKQLYFRRSLPARAARRAALVEEVAGRFKAMTPFVTFLDVGLARVAPAAPLAESA